MPKFELSLYQLYFEFRELYYTFDPKDKAEKLRQFNGNFAYSSETGIYTIEFATQEDYIHYKLYYS